MDNAASFKLNGYVVLNSLLNDPQLSQFYRYICTSAERGRFSREDTMAPGSPALYSDFIINGLLDTLLPEVEQASGLELYPTYTYFRLYQHGDTLRKHHDRESCEISVSLCLGFESEKRWPLHIEGLRGVAAVSLGPGDAVLYRGIDHCHWREPFTGAQHAQVFLHYVDKNGPYAEWKYDKRRVDHDIQRIRSTT